MFAWFQRLLPRTGDFFGMFEAHAATLVGAAKALSRLVDGGTAHKEHIGEIHRFEHQADDVIRDVLRTVRKTFLTPFDRGAITSLIGAMDDAIDEMQDTARAIDVYELDSFTPEMKQMVSLIGQQAGLTSEAIPLLRDITRNGARIHELTEKLVRLESEADVVHAAGLKKAFRDHAAKPMQFMVARETYKHLERITDAFEDVANEIDGIVIDHA
jgi:predicted phosphate transport protein (TIGR00153 family)